MTRSDVLGYILPIFGVQWHYNELVGTYKKLEDLGYKIVYLTARTMSDYKTTKEYLATVKHKDDLLPKGPLFLHPRSFFLSLKSDIVNKNADVTCSVYLDL